MTTPRVPSRVELLVSTGQVMSRGNLGGRSEIAAPTGLASQLIGSGGRSSGTASAGAAAGAATDILTTLGDLLGHTGTTYVRLTVGTDGQIAVADSSAQAGLRYATLVSYVPLGDGDPDDPGYLFTDDGDPIYVTAASDGLGQE